MNYAICVGNLLKFHRSLLSSSVMTFFFFFFTHHAVNTLPSPSSEVTDSLAERLQLRLLPLVGLHPLSAVTAGAVGEVQGVVEAAELGVMMPAQVIAFMGDVALVHAGL